MTARRDSMVVEAVRSRDLPLAGVIGGGYGSDVEAVARRHLSLFRAAAGYAA